MSRWSTETQRANLSFEPSISSSERGFPFFSVSHSNSVKGRRNLDFSKLVGLGECGEGFSIYRSEYRSLRVIAFRPQLSTRNRRPPAGFLTNKTVAALHVFLEWFTYSTTTWAPFKVPEACFLSWCGAGLMRSLSRLQSHVSGVQPHGRWLFSEVAAWPFLLC